MPHDEYMEAILDLQAVTVADLLGRAAGWEDAEPQALNDPVLREMAVLAHHAPMALLELEHRALQKFPADTVRDRVSRVEWARNDPDALQRASERVRRAKRVPGMHPTPIRYEHVVNDDDLNEPLIDGLLRRGETMNIIAPPKIGKTWLVHGLALAMATGDEWLGRQTTRSRVLLVDNELHTTTMQHRLAKMMHSCGIDPGENLDALSLRGALKNLYAVCDWLLGYPAGQWDVVVCDAFYRMVPAGKSENDNAEMAGLYNHLDRTASELGIAFVLIHHTSKGNQAGKGVTDVGSGAGSMARAADCHVVLRRHRDENCVAMEAAARSFPPPEPVVLEWDYPRWLLRPDLEPHDLDDGVPPSSADEWPLERVAREIIQPAPTKLAELKATLRGRGCSERHARAVVKAIEAARTIRIMDTGRDTMVYREDKP